MELDDEEAEYQQAMTRWRAECRRTTELYEKALMALWREDERYRVNLIKYRRWTGEQKLRWIDSIEAQVRRGVHDGIAAAVVSMAVTIRMEK